MTVHTNIDGAWREAKTPSTNIGGAWRELETGHSNIGGVHREFYKKAVPGQTWTLRQSTYDCSWHGIAYGNGLFVAVGVDTGFGSKIMTSTNGATWSAVTPPANVGSYLYNIGFGNGVFVATRSYAVDEVYTSTDAQTWATRSLNGYKDRYFCICYGSNRFVIIADFFPEIIMYSTATGTTWSYATPPSDYRTNNRVWTSVCYGSGLYVAVANEVCLSYGTPVSGKGRVMTSTAGTTWSVKAGTPDYAWQSVCYGNGIYVAVGSSGAVMTSPDGSTWTMRTSAVYAHWYSVCYGNGMFVAIGTGGGDYNSMTSVDGINWVSSKIPVDNDWRSLCYAEDKNMFAAVGRKGTGNRVMTSP